MTHYPHVKVDFAHRMLSVLLRDGKVAWTDQLDDAHLVDLDSDGTVIALDILTPDDLRIDEMAERFGFADQARTIRAAIQRAMAPTVSSAGDPLVVKAVLAPAPPAAGETEEAPKRPVVPPVEATG